MARTKSKPVKMKKEKTQKNEGDVEKAVPVAKKRRADKQGRKMLRRIKRAQQSADPCIPRAVCARFPAPPPWP